MLRSILASAPMFSCAFWCIALIADYKHYNRGKIVLAVFMFVATIHFFCQAAFCSYEYELTYYIDALYFYVTLSVFPLYYLYIRVLTDKKRLGFRSLWVFIPAVILGTIAGILYYMMSAEESYAFVRQILFRQPGTYEFSMIGKLQRINLLVLDIVFAFLIFPVAYYGVKRITKYNRQIAEYYSNQEGKTLLPRKSWLYAFVFTSFASAIFNAIGRYMFADPMWMLFIASFFFVLMLFTLGLIGFRQDFTIDNFLRDEEKADKKELVVSDESSISMQDNLLRRKTLKMKMIHLLEKEELFKEPDLRITDLATRMGSNRAYVSRIINQDMQTSFLELVNSYRINYAKKLLRESRSSLTSISEISELSGFSSESSFYRIFKNYTGVSPKTWRSKANYYENAGPIRN